MKIKLYNRYHVPIILNQISDTKYELTIESKNPEREFDYMGWTSFNQNEPHDTNELMAIDPSGGPYIAKGLFINKNKIVKITKDNNKFFVEFEHKFDNIDECMFYDVVSK